MTKTLLEKMEEAARRPVPYEGFSSFGHPRKEAWPNESTPINKKENQAHNEKKKKTPPQAGS